MLLFGKNTEYEIYRRVLNDEMDAYALSELAGLGADYHFGGCLWKVFIAWLLIHDENAYSLACELRGSTEDSLSMLTERDLSEIFKAFNRDFSKDSIAGIHFHTNSSGRESSLSEIGALASALAQDLDKCATVSDFKSVLDCFYTRHGVGAFGLNRAFYLENKDRLSLKAVDYLDPVRFDDLWGYELQKKELMDNTELFLNGGQANNVLLYGDSGTGKSTAVKALLNEYGDRGLRIVEIYKHQFQHLSDLIDILKKRNYRFVIFMDDLSFEDFEIEYKYLKALIEGGLEPKPSNILIYATSNRRHLIKESHNDRADTDDRHRSDTVQEKLSLAERFGISIFYPKPVSMEYYDMILHLAKLNHIDINRDELLNKAHIWGMEHGRLSGRVARQFINHLQN